ncbi:glycoside hydrolase family 88 protein [Pedobacter frigiditerrae]|uniref:Glycoside hydrolase family 88 protein n=1 Tax=Pedobacter frigiditerrae TaxID=2530452 RepID=A0A4V2MHP2_9SPHI|nr:glycoside hydrolase family 88 protein [Pedobacter frigiditerrae]TCC87286.1 glycoside hydrolase family 88 protein [Pedobacter frigiditerrae]
MNKRISLFFLILFFLSTGVAQSQSSALTSDSIFFQMKKVADWQWKTLETVGWKNPKKDWTSGAMYTGMVAWAKIANDETYYRKLIQVGEDNKWQVGKYRYFADDYCVGQLYSQLYKIYKDPKYIADFKALADTITTLPHTEGLEWKKSIYLREWAWCDALFMGPPALGYLTEATGDAKYLDKSAQLWMKTTEYLYDKDEHLYYRDSRYFDKKEKNGTKVFWGRGNGWVIGGLVRVLSVMPKNHPERKKLEGLFTDMSSKLATLQQPDGSWHASLLDPASYPSKETSGTGFICYAMAWGINNGLLPAKKYQPVVNKAWLALVTAVHPDGKLGFVQAQGAAPDKVTYNDTDVYGVGAFLLAGSEMLPLYLNHKNNVFIKEVYNETASSKKQIVEVKWSDIKKEIKKADPKKVVVTDAATHVLIPSTIIYKGKKPQLLQYTVDLSTGTNRYFEISTK